MTRLVLIVSFWLCLAVEQQIAFAAEPLDLKAELSRPIITPQTSLEETQVYLERRIPRLPEVKTTQDWDSLAAKWRKDVLDKVVFRGEAAQWRDHPLSVETTAALAVWRSAHTGRTHARQSMCWAVTLDVAFCVILRTERDVGLGAGGRRRNRLHARGHVMGHVIAGIAHG